MVHLFSYQPVTWPSLTSLPSFLENGRIIMLHWLSGRVSAWLLFDYLFLNLHPIPQGLSMLHLLPHAPEKPFLFLSISSSNKTTQGSIKPMATCGFCMKLGGMCHRCRLLSRASPLCETLTSIWNSTLGENFREELGELGRRQDWSQDPWLLDQVWTPTCHVPLVNPFEHSKL